MEGAECMIAEQPDPKKPWGIGCVICSRYRAWLSSKITPATEGSAASTDERGGSTWATFGVGSGGAKSLGIEDLLRHVGRASEKKPADRFHATAMEHFKSSRAADPDTAPLLEPNIGMDERNDVPTLSHMRV